MQKFYDRVIKRLFDLVLSCLGLPILGLVLLVLAPIIYLEDKGSVFYNAQRVGKDGRLFIMYKLRSMKMNAPDLTLPDGSTYNGSDDPRMTRIGAFMRKTSLDELPQILNVFKGDMSFIGPRPDLERETLLYQGNEGNKLLVRPGITGYAAVYGRNSLPWHDRLKLDVEYVERESFWLDLKIFFRTFYVIFKQDGIYVEDEAKK